MYKLTKTVIIGKNRQNKTINNRIDKMKKKDTIKLRNKTLTAEEKIEVKSFLLGNSIIQVHESAIKSDANGTAIENAKKWAKNHSEVIIRQDIGKVVFNSKGVGKPIKNIILVAPIRIGSNERNFLCIRLVKNIGDDNRLHIHEVFDTYELKNTAIPFQTPGADLTVCPQRGIAIYLNILQATQGSNYPNSVDLSLSLHCICLLSFCTYEGL